MLDAGQWALEHAAELALPTLVMHGTSDPVTAAQATIDFAQRTGRLCTLRTFPGLYHELHWEHNSDEAFEVVLDWLTRLITELGD